MARKSHSNEFSNLLSSCSIFVSRSLDASDHSEVVVDTYSSTLKDFMTQKHTLLHATFVAQYIRRHPLRAWPLHSALVKYLAPGQVVNTYRQVQAYEILSGLAPHLPAIAKIDNGVSSKSEINTFVGKVIDSFYAVLNKAGSEGEKDKDSWNAQRLKEVIKAMLALSRGAKSAGVEWDVKRLESEIEGLRSGRIGGMKGVMGLMTQLVAVVGGGAGKQKADGKAKKDGKGKDKGKGKGKDTSKAEEVPAVSNGTNGAVEVDGEDVIMADGLNLDLDEAEDEEAQPSRSKKVSKEKGKGPKKEKAKPKVFSNDNLLLPPVMPAKKRKDVDGTKKGTEKEKGKKVKI